MENILRADMETVNGRVKFRCGAEGREPIYVDYVPPVGNGEGYTSLELLLVSMGTCLGSGVKVIAENRFHRAVGRIAVAAEGRRRETHPTSFSEVALILSVDAPELSSQELETIIRIAEGSVCPVLAMVKGNTEIRIRYELNGAGTAAA